MNVSKTTPLYLTRFLAAYLVLIYHYGTPQLHTFSEHFGEAVNYFFFISGFVMVVSSQKFIKFNIGIVNFSKADFWIKRIARIYPMYLLALAAFVIYNYAVKEIDRSILTRIWLEIIGIQRWFYDGSVNFPAWSVSCEIFFYLLFPFVLPFIAKFSLGRLSKLILVLYILSLLFTYFYGKYLPVIPFYQHSKLIRFGMDAVLNHPIFKFTIFLSGCLCGRFYLTSPKMVFVEKYSNLICLSSLLVIVVGYRYNLANKYWLDAGILCIVYFPFVLSLCSLNGKVLKAFSWKPFVFLGEISYGMYIIHAPVQHYFSSLLSIDDAYFYKNSQFFVYTLLLILLCSILYYLYEMPARNMIVSWYKIMKQKRSSV